MFIAWGGGPMFIAWGGGPMFIAWGGGPIFIAWGGGPMFIAWGGGPIFIAWGGFVPPCVAPHVCCPVPLPPPFPEDIGSHPPPTLPPPPRGMLLGFFADGAGGRGAGR